MSETGKHQFPGSRDAKDSMTEEKTIDLQGAVCPVPLPHKERIVMGHGSGGKMSHDLIKQVFLPRF
jgi:hydrogenase expression/formation protein HypE